MKSTSRTASTASTRTTRSLARAGAGLALLGGIVVVSAVPASAAGQHHPVRHPVTRTAHAGSPATTVQLGPAVAYTRSASGTVSRVR